MNWKVFTTACVSAALIGLPQNSFTCGPSEDPYDYYTSFFSQSAAGKEYRPFYYTSLLTFYDEWSADTAARDADKVLQEWTAYAKTANLKDAAELVYDASVQDVTQLGAALNTGALPASLKTNSLAQALVKEKKTEAIRYLLFAKKSAALSPASQWDEAPKRDSLTLNKSIAEATDAYNKASDPFLKNKWAFQRCKVAFYNHRYPDCVRFYDEHFTDGNASAVAPLAHSYKAGSLFRSGRKKEAAYLFSKAFAQQPQNKKQNYLGFWWASNNADASLIPAYAALCKNNEEKAAMLGMFALYGVSYKLNEMQQVRALNPASPLLPLLATREIHKLEENYLTPLLNGEKGGKELYVSWADVKESKTTADGKTQAAKTAQFLETLLNDKTLPARNLYGVGAAYLRYMGRDYEGAKALLAKLNPAEAAQKDQAQLIALLIAANEAKAVTKETEAQLLPSMRWLAQKAKTDEEYRPFCRNFFSQILAQRYEQQGDASRAALAYGMADLAYVSDGENDWYSYRPAIAYVRESLDTDALLKLYKAMTAPATETETFFVQHASFKRDAVVDVLGTAHLRDRAYAKAIEWFAKAGKPQPLIETNYNYTTGKETTVKVDPLHDYLNDWQRFGKTAAVAYTKLSLAKKLLELQTKIQNIDTVADKAKLYYTYASALYNLSYYGNAWSAVAYYRSGGDWNTGKYDAPWQKEYFGVHEARSYYQKAYDAAASREFKAACLFMVIKCAQRQVAMPDYDYKAEAASNKAADEFDRQFRYNPLFGKFRSEFEGTKFYQYAFTRCGYLRDYVKRGQSPARPKR